MDVEMLSTVHWGSCENEKHVPYIFFENAMKGQSGEWDWVYWEVLFKEPDVQRDIHNNILSLYEMWAVRDSQIVNYLTHILM